MSGGQTRTKDNIHHLDYICDIGKFLDTLHYFDSIKNTGDIKEILLFNTDTILLIVFNPFEWLCLQAITYSHTIIDMKGGEGASISLFKDL